PKPNGIACFAILSDGTFYALLNSFKKREQRLKKYQRRMAEIALENVDGVDRRFYQAKIDTARFYMQRLLPQSSGLFSAIMAGSGTIMAFDDDAF
ncbi:MAG: acyl-CoA dehydrogenase C-terminal domain-containing protein, partial [Candidatus Thiodiazotropha sp.]